MSATITISEITAEPEETIEAALVSILSQVCSTPIIGFITPATEGEAKQLSADTFVGVSVDQTSQDLDFAGPNVPRSYAATVTVHYALADDASGCGFRDECRRVRAALLSLTGDGCANLGAAGFACDALTLDGTSSNFDGGENPTNTKAYSVTLKGRTINTTNTTEAE